MNAKPSPNEYVIEAITQSLLTLAKEKRIAEISVIELVTHAGVSRNSFYRNFDSKEHILQKYVAQVTDRYVQTNHLTEAHYSVKERAALLFTHLQSHDELTRIIFRNGLQEMLREQFERTFIEVDHDLPTAYAVFLAGGYFNLYCYWVKHDYRLDVDALSDVIGRIVSADK